MIESEQLTQHAIEACQEGIARGQSPFGCAIALGDRVLARAHNTVVLTTDITAHAEIKAIRAACGATDYIFLTGARMATACEPCPMCMAASHWAIRQSVF